MIEIQIKTEHFKESSGYGSLTECPLALACKDYFPEGICICVGGYSVNVGIKRYEISNNWANLIDPFKINKMIEEDHEMMRIQRVK